MGKGNIKKLSRVHLIGNTASKTLKSEIDKASKNKNTKLKHKLQFLQLANQLYKYKTQKQLDAEQVTAGANPKYRGIQMKPFIKKWKHEETRCIWKRLTNKVVKREYIKQMGVVVDDKIEERVNQAVNFFTQKELFNTPVPFSDIAITEPVKKLESFQTQKSNVPEGVSHIISPAPVISRSIRTVENSAKKDNSLFILLGIGSAVLIVILLFMLRH